MAPGAVYRHTQRSSFGMWVLLVAIAASLGIATATGSLNGGFVAVALPVYLLVGIVVAVFARLTVTVTDGRVTAAFGWGWPARTIALTEVRGVNPVRNSWWYGWGLRWIPHGTMYNVWGREAVELELAEGRVFRIGTDDVDGLRAALESGSAAASRR